MKKVVVDASVAVKWFVPEIHSAAAARLLDPATLAVAEKCALVTADAKFHSVVVASPLANHVHWVQDEV
jgi:predicted nucleic acid-binding protein